jgi:hypothetical protein
MCRKKIEAVLAAVWSRFLRRNFSGPREVSDFFGCPLSTAYDWWSGDRRPSASAVLKAQMTPAGAALLDDLRKEGL